ncbi:uncharacterized protein LOC131428720 [Malaya genurostris]|uniref:uncharacterized protein LOC131428720 n=1 Tax=Malaya genurostris TaxID=325434 RepID=UPI0026F37ECB|nr:uncharacterized protein LOC131428720 [Malaya genurostris]
MGIHLVCLYANCTRILQPLDVAVFKPMKSSWLKVVDDWKCLNPNKYLKTENFAPLLAKAIKSVESKIIQNGFKACGLYPFNENNIDYSKCLANSLPVGENFENKGTDTRQITSLTFPIVRSKAVEILTLIGPDRISLYKRNNPDDFPSDEDKILARVYKLLEPLDSSSNMNIPGSNTTKMHIEPNMHIAEFVNMDNVESVTEVEYLDKQESYESGMLDFYQSTSEDPLKECVSDLNIIQQNNLTDEICENISQISLSQFLTSPETPHRTGNRRFKHRSPAVLTSRRRLQYHKALQEEKVKEIEVKQRKAELRKKKQLEEKKRKRQIAIFILIVFYTLMSEKYIF